MMWCTVSGVTVLFIIIIVKQIKKFSIELEMHLRLM